MKFKWSWKVWYVDLIVGILLAWFYIELLLNYGEAIEVARVSTSITKEGWYDDLLFIFDTLWGKTTTLIIMGIITLIPFITAGYKLRKVIKKRREKNEQEITRP